MDGTLTLPMRAQALTATSLPQLGAPQLEIANVAITLPASVLDSKQVIYVDVRCGSSVFRTTAQAKKFDPLASAHGDSPLAFDIDKGILTLPYPIVEDTDLFFSVRRCQIFGDSDLCSVAVPVAAIPLLKRVNKRYSAGCFAFDLLPVNLGFDGQSLASPSAGGVTAVSDFRQYNYFEAQEELRRRSTAATTGSGAGSANSTLHGNRPYVEKSEPMPSRESLLAAQDGPPPPPPPAPQTQLGTLPPPPPPPAAAQQASAVAAPVAPVAASEAPVRGRALFPDSAQEAFAAFGAPPAVPRSNGAVAVAVAATGSDVVQPLGGAIPCAAAAAGPSIVTAVPTSWADGPLQIIRNEEQLKDLMYRGQLPPPSAAPTLPPGYVRIPRLKQLLSRPPNDMLAAGATGSPAGQQQGAVAARPQQAPRSGGLSIGGIGMLFGALSHAVAGAAGELSSTVDVEMMRTSFPTIRSPLVDTFTPHALNGHGTPIPGKLYVTTTDVAFDGPLLKFHLQLANIFYMRRCAAFGKDCIQLFCANHVAYQLQDFDGMIARFGNVSGLRDHTSFYNAFTLLLDLWTTARGAPQVAGGGALQ